jgi:hypothetical protein
MKKVRGEERNEVSVSHQNFENLHQLATQYENFYFDKNYLHYKMSKVLE